MIVTRQTPIAAASRQRPEALPLPPPCSNAIALMPRDDTRAQTIHDGAIISEISRLLMPLAVVQHAPTAMNRAALIKPPSDVRLSSRHY